MRWLFIILFFLGLVPSSQVGAQSDLTRIPCGDGFSSLRGVVGEDDRWYFQGTLPDQMVWDGKLIGSGAGEDIFFAVVDPVSGLEWSSVWGGGGEERILSSPLIGPGSDNWLFFGEAVDSLRIGSYSYRPTLSSFFSFIGMQSTEGELKKVRCFESSGSMEISAAIWDGNRDRIIISGRAEAPVLSAGDTVVNGPEESYAFIALIDTQLTVMKYQLITGVARAFDLLYKDGQIMAGFSIRDLIRFDGQVVQARIQDLDCLVTAWGGELNGVNWYHKLGGVYDKTGVALLPGRNPGAVLVAGDFVGSISDGTGLQYESNGFEPDLFVWEFSGSGQTLYGSVAGGPQREELRDIFWQGDTLQWLIQFREGFDFFGSSFRTAESGYHLAHLTMGPSGELLSREVLIGIPDVFGFDLLDRGGRPGILGGFTQEVRDTTGRRLLEKEGVGPVDYFIRFRPSGVNVIDRPSVPDLVVYPNPVSDVLFISVTEPFDNGEIQIFDLAGKCQITSDRHPIDIRQLAAGVYIVRYGGRSALFSKQ